MTEDLQPTNDLTPDSPDAAQELGGNIILVGFKELETGELIVVKKIVGSYARKMSDSSTSFESLTVTLKTVHQTAKSAKCEVHARLLDNGQLHTGEAVERNLFIALDTCLRRALDTKQHKEKAQHEQHKSHHG